MNQWLRRVVYGIGIIILAAGPTWAAKETPIKVSDRELKIGIVDLQKIMRTSKVVKAAMDEFMKEVEAKRNILTTKAREVQALEQELSKLDPKTPADQRREKENKLKRQSRELNNQRQDIEEDLKKRDREVTQKVMGEIMVTIRNFAQAEHYSLILERSSIVAADEALDITDKIVKLHDAKKK